MSEAVTTGIRKIDSTLPDILPESEEAWIKLQETPYGPRMLRALQRVAGGSSVRAAGTAEGYASLTDIYRHAKKWGLVDTRTKAIINTHKSVAKISGEELERRLIEAPDDVTTRDLTVINGVATDKLLAYEKQNKSDGGNYISALEAVAARVVESGASMELKVTIIPPAGVDSVGEVRETDVIDVTEVSSDR